MLWLLLGLFLVLLLTGFPIVLAMGIPALTYAILQNLPMSTITYSIFQSLNSFSFIAVPMFILMGQLINEFRQTHRVFNFARLVLRGTPGYTARVNVIVSLIFSGISGASLADIGGLGQMEVRAMENEGFSRGYAAALTTATSLVGPIFPPSVPLIIFAMAAEVSTVRALIAGAVPALVITALLYVSVMLQAKSKIRDHAAARVQTPRSDGDFLEKNDFRQSFLESLPILIAAPAIIVSMLRGIFSPSEAGVAGVIYMLLVGLMQKEVTWNKLKTAFLETFRSTANILLIVSVGSFFTRMLTMEQVPRMISGFFLGISDNPIIILLLVNLLALMMGMFMEGISAIILLTPILLPIMNAIGVDPLQLGVFLVFNLMIGLATPPFGLGVYTVANVVKARPDDVFRELLPMYLPLVAALLVITFVPWLSTWLPKLIFG